MVTPLVGIDIASAGRVSGLLARRDRFRTRVFTDAEAAYCGDDGRRWAARWAAKEAVRKLAGAAGLALPAWRDIEVVRDDGGAPRAAVRGWLDPVALSLSHDGDLAVAVAVATEPPLVVGDAALFTGVRLPDRDDEGHKGTFGTVVVVAGSRGLSGAAYLAAMGAARGGAGLVRVCVPESVYAAVAAKCIEVMPHPLPDSEGGLDPGAVGVLLEEHLAHAAALVVGCGLGRRPATEQTLLTLLAEARVPAVVDADGLTIIAAHTEWDWAWRKAATVLTPHPAEMARLCGVSTADVQKDRRGAAVGLAARTGAVVVLKGAGTVVAAPDGRVHLDPHHVVALATGGTGDVLAGVCGAMLGQGLEAFDAAVAAVTVHAEAGLLVQSERGRAGGLATDVLDALPRAQERIRRVLEAGR